MGIAAGMKAITQDIVSSHEDRKKKIGEIREEVNQARGEAHDMIKGFEGSRQETDQQLRRDLARDKAHRKSETRGILRETQDILKGFGTSRKGANVKLREDLSQGTAVIRSEVREIMGEAQKLIKGFGASRQTVISKLRKDLSKSRAKSKSEVGKLMGDAQSLVNGFQASRREAGSQLRGDLAQSKANMESDSKKMLSDFGKAREDVRADLKEARVAWQELTSTMPAKRSGAEIPQEAETLVAEETIDLEAKILAAVNEHSEGITLTEIADSLGVARVVLGRASKSLLDKGKIRKDEKLYFPAVSE